jgi:hypothetical protein
MPDQLSLREVERKAWQSYLQDGLAEVFLGALLLLAFLAGVSGERRFFVYIPMLLMGPALLLAKRLITVPRLGHVKFGQERRARKRKLLVVVAAAVIVTLVLLAVTMRGALPAEWIREHHSLVSFGLGGMIALVFAATAYWKDYPRLYLVGLIIGAAFTLTELFDTPVPLLVAGAIVFLVGLVILIRFVRKFPIPAVAGPTERAKGRP